MFTKVKIQNFRSFVDAEVSLRPFSLVVGANGAGKSNFLRAVHNCLNQITASTPHVNREPQSQIIALFDANGTGHSWWFQQGFDFRFTGRPLRVALFSIDPRKVSQAESLVAQPEVNFDGSGTTQVLDALKNGERDDLFLAVEAAFKRFVPEVKKLSFMPQPNSRQLQISEHGLSKALPAYEVSEGTRIILCLLTILHQENAPKIILLEDIDRGLHPRLFEQMAPLIRQMAIEHDINVIATTQNPYLVDHFQDDKEAVIIVEKKDGASTLTTLADKLREIGSETAEDDLPLGALWYSGLVGGVPMSSKL